MTPTGKSWPQGAFDTNHLDTVALLSGPLVLFPITQGQPRATRSQLLSTLKTGARHWQTSTAGGAITLLPFTDIDEQQYATYFQVAHRA